jgi:hypothetical protein
MTTTTQPVLPPLAASKLTLRHFVVLWLIVAGLEGILLTNNGAADSFLWRTTRWAMSDQGTYVWADIKQPPAPGIPFYQTAEPPLHAQFYKKTEKFWRMLRDMGEPFCTAILLATLAVYDRRRWKASVILLASAIGTSLVAELIRCITGRLRPDGTLPTGLRNSGDSMFHFLGGFTHHSDLSFPSGHATLAFATAATLCYFSPRGRWLFLVLAAGCALARVVMQAHFFGDVIMGATVGWTIGWVVTVGLDRAFGGSNAESRSSTPQ